MNLLGSHPTQRFQLALNLDLKWIIDSNQFMVIILFQTLDALDSGNYKLGLNLCNKWLKKAPDSPLLLVLRAYALDKIGNLKESMEICDSLLEEKILDDF